MVVKKRQRTAEVRLPSSRQGVSKPLIVGIIALVAILALSSLLLFSDVFVGKAVSFLALNAGEAGFAIDQQVNTLKVGESQVFPVNINLGSQKSSIVSFELKYDAQKVSPDCSKIYGKLDKVFNYVNEQNTGLVVIRESSCANGKVMFTYGALADQQHLITGQQTLAEITFTALNSPGQTSLQFTPNLFKVYDLESMTPALFDLKVKDGVLQVQAEAPQPVCGNGVKEGAEECDLGNDNGVISKSCSHNCKTWLSCTPDNANGVVMTTSAGKTEFKATCTGDSIISAKSCLENPVSYTTKNIQCDPGKVCKLDENKVAVCVSAPQYQCTGSTPFNSILCIDDNMGLSQDTPKKAVSQCSMDNKCEYLCNEKYAPNNEKKDCVASQLPPPPPPPVPGIVEPEGVSVQGTKVKLTDVLPADNVFATKITATAMFGEEVTVYTVLYDKDNKVLALKLEKVAGLAKDQVYTAAVNYPEAKVKKKSVIIYDVKQNPTVFGSLDVEKQP